MADPNLEKTHKQAVVKFVDTPHLKIAYEEHGDSKEFPVILLHGFPYDVRSWDEVVTLLVNSGHRVIVPYIRGYGPTEFLDSDVSRMAQQSAIAQDVIDLMDSLGLNRVGLAGFDWGNRATCIASYLQPERVKALVAIGGYPVQNTVKPQPPSGAMSNARMWYQWYFNTEQGVVGLRQKRHDIIRYLWDTWSPTWKYTDEVYKQSSKSFDNVDFVDVVIHSYRHRHMNAVGEQRFMDLEKRLAQSPVIDVPTIVLRGTDNGFGRPSADFATDKNNFPKLVDTRLVEKAGHDLPRHRPDAVAEALSELITL